MTTRTGQLRGATSEPRRFVFAVAIVAIAAAGIAAWLFPRALPLLALEHRITREQARARADSFLLAHDLSPGGARRAIRFQSHDSLRTYVELAGGGPDSLNALVHGRDVAPFTWSVRAFQPGDVHEVRVDLAPDGRILGFERTLAEADRRPALDADSARRLASAVLVDWIGEPRDRWRAIASSYDTRKGSNRIDRSFTFERADRRVAGAPIRVDIVIAGDLPTRARHFVEIPESFQRRYREMRSSNELFALVASLGALLIAVAGVAALVAYSRMRRVRWREAFVVGGVIGALAFIAALNEMPGGWFDYDTALSPSTFVAMLAGGALAQGAATALLGGLTLAAAEAATRDAFPGQLDWWKLWRYRGTREVAGQVAGGYAAAAIAFAYVAVFYLATRTLFGWWVPGELLDDPNQIASPMPWISGIAISLNAGVWEEALFRALPLALLSTQLGARPRRTAWMAGGVILTALIFGFAHASYDSWPPYSRGVEIFLDACFWALLFLRFGLLVTVVAHYAFDLVLFGLFAASGSAAEYRITAAILLAALLAPAIAVGWRWVRQRALLLAPADARFAAWTADAVQARAPTPPARVGRTMTQRTRRVAGAVVAASALAALASPPRPVLGPPFTADRARALAVADSVIRDRGADPGAWTRLSTTAVEPIPGWSRFLSQHELVPQAQRLARSYAASAWWVVRYVRTDGVAAQRAEEWRVRLWPDGRPLDARHVLPETARRDTAGAPEARVIALRALARAGVDTARLREVELRETARPARRDVTVTYHDTSVHLPAGAAARAWVQIGGDEPLVARRGVELPEAFLRAERERQSTRSMIAALCAVVLVVGVVLGVILAIRRCQPVIDDGVLDRRAKVVVVVAVAALALVQQAISLPTTLFAYDTSEPWSSFIGVTVLSAVFVVPVSLAALGLWLTLTALRRRVGIPMLHGAPSSATSQEVVLAGLGVGATVFGAAALRDLLPSGGVPRVPRTLLHAAVPWLSDAIAIPAEVMFAVAIIGIPVLVVATLTRRWPVRVLATAAMAILAGVAVGLQSTSSDVPAWAAPLLVVQVALVVAAFRAWGATSGWSWVVAALAHQALGGLRLAAHAATAQERGAGILAALAAVALIAAIARLARAGRNPIATNRQRIVA